MNKNIINIHKQAGTRKNAVRINSAADIPEFLQGTISIENGEIRLICVEGQDHCALGSVIGYEASENTDTGWNSWHIANAATNLVEVDGIFYNKATVMTAMAVSEEFPEFLHGAIISRNADRSWAIITDWGVSYGFPGKAYWVLYGYKADGTPDANILTKTEQSYKEYIVCDNEGNDIGFLSEIDPA